MVDVRLVVHRSTWEGYDVEVTRFDSYPKTVKSIAELVKVRGRSLVEVFDFTEHDGVFPLPVVKKFIAAVTDHSFVSRLYDGRVSYVGDEAVSVAGKDDGSERIAWVVFTFQGRFFKLTGDRVAGRVAWADWSTLVEVEETLVPQPAVSAWSNKK